MSSGRFVDGAEVGFKVDVNEGVDGVVVDAVDVDGVKVDVEGVDGAVVAGEIVDGVEVSAVVLLDGCEVVPPFTGQLRTGK